jgi:predicted nuclease with RNAse H fold
LFVLSACRYPGFLSLMKRKKKTRVVGVDLAGSPRRNTGICLLEGMTVSSYATVHGDEEILSFIDRARPDLIAVDAPLSLPPGRKTLEERTGEHFRASDRELLKRGIKFFPITLGPMRMLTMRGIGLKEALRERGHEVIEIYPGAAQDIWTVPRKQWGLSKLRRGLERLGLKGLGSGMNGDELDAVTGALVGRLYLTGGAEALGSVDEGAIIVPRPIKRRPRTAASKSGKVQAAAAGKSGKGTRRKR